MMTLMHSTATLTRKIYHIKQFLISVTIKKHREKIAIELNKQRDKNDKQMEKAKAKEQKKKQKIIPVFK